MNCIKKYYLNRRLRDFVRKKMDKKISVHTLKDANSICFFITNNDSNRVENLIKSVSIYKEKKITIICYLPHKKDINIADMPPFLYIVSQKDIGLTGRVSEQAKNRIHHCQYSVFMRWGRVENRSQCNG